MRLNGTPRPAKPRDLIAKEAPHKASTGQGHGWPGLSPAMTINPPVFCFFVITGLDPVIHVREIRAKFNLCRAFLGAIRGFDPPVCHFPARLDRHRPRQLSGTRICYDSLRVSAERSSGIEPFTPALLITAHTLFIRRIVQIAVNLRCGSATARLALRSAGDSAGGAYCWRICEYYCHVSKISTSAITLALSF